MLIMEPGTKKGDIRTRPGSFHYLGILLNLADTADTRADGTANPRRIFLGHLEPTVHHRLHACRHAVLDEDVHLARLLGRQVGGDIEIPHTGTELGAIGRYVETLDEGRTALTRQDIFPGLGDGVTHRAYYPEACNDNSSAYQRADSSVRAFSGSLN